MQESRGLLPNATVYTFVYRYLSGGAKMLETNLIEFRVGEDLMREISSRCQPQNFSAGTTARRDLTRYYALLAGITPKFTKAEAALIMDALNGIMLDQYTFRLLWAEVADAIRMDNLDRKWNVDGESLVERLRSLHPAEMMALLDAVERAWNMIGYGGQMSLDEALRAVGLIGEG